MGYAIMCTYFVNRMGNNCLIKNFCYTVSCTSTVLCTQFCNGLFCSVRELFARDAEYFPHALCLLSHTICRFVDVECTHMTKPVNSGRKYWEYLHFIQMSKYVSTVALTQLIKSPSLHFGKPNWLLHLRKFEKIVLNEPGTAGAKKPPDSVGTETNI